MINFSGGHATIEHVDEGGDKRPVANQMTTGEAVLDVDVLWYALVYTVSYQAIADTMLVSESGFFVDNSNSFGKPDFVSCF